METAKRLHTVEEYYFSQKLREVRRLAEAGKPVINIGIGNPDLPPPPEAIKALEEALTEPGAHRYQGYQGIPELRRAMADFYREKFEVALDPDTELLPLMGAKEGIMHISLAFLNKDDVALIPNPGYATYTSVTRLMQAVPKYYELSEATHWLPDLESLEKEDLTRVKIMWVSYPHMPTGAKASQTDFEKLVAFAKKHDILIVNDNPYSFILNEEPLSLLTVEGAKETCLELNSLSKTFNMAGWRVGMVAGSAAHSKAVLNVKSNMDSGMFYPVQKGAIAALGVDNEWFTALNEVYRKRRALVFQLASALGCTYTTDTAGMFVWARLPEGTDTEKFTDELLYKKHIFIAPGTIFGSRGAGYIRFSLCVPEAKIEEAVARVKNADYTAET